MNVINFQNLLNLHFKSVLLMIYKMQSFLNVKKKKLLRGNNEKFKTYFCSTLLSDLVVISVK